VQTWTSTHWLRDFLKKWQPLKHSPKYDFIWDPTPVIAHLASLYPHEDLSLGALSTKLVTLLALTTAQRLQTLAAIQWSNISFAEALSIRIPARLETSSIGKS